MGNIKNFDPTDIVGQTFGRLKVLELAKKELVVYRSKQSHYKYYYKCQCNCKNKTIIYVARGDLKSGDTKSCGCINKELRHNRWLRHNMTGTRFHTIWRSMIGRCNDKTNDIYGGRGITYDPRWKVFENFRDDMYEDYLKRAAEVGDEKLISIDRIDSNGNYCKENCKWSTFEEQAGNKRNTVKVNYNNETVNLRQIYNNSTHDDTVPFGLFAIRIYKNWDIDKALNQPHNTYKLYFYNCEHLTIPEIIAKYGYNIDYITVYERLRLDAYNNKYHVGFHIFNPKLFQKDLNQPYCPIRYINNNTDS